MKKINTSEQINAWVSFTRLFSKRSKLLLLYFFLLVLFPALASSQNCDLILIAKNNVESVNEQGRTYFMELTNNGSTEKIVTISLSDQFSGNNPDASDGKNNVTLKSVLLNEDGKEISNVTTINPGQLFRFLIKVTVPDGTPIEHWNTILVSGYSEACSDESPSLILYTFLPGKEE